MELATGTVVKSHGVRGDLVVDVRTDSPEERFAVGTTITLRHTSGVTSHHEVTAARWHQRPAVLLQYLPPAPLLSQKE